MIKHKEQRVGVFIDVANMYHSAKNLHGSRVNFKEVLEAAVDGRRLMRAIAYAIKSDSEEEVSFFQALDKSGFEVKTKDLQIFPGGAKKADWDVGIAVDAITIALKLDVVVLVTGDGDFIPLVEFLQFQGLLVELVSFGETTSSGLRAVVDDVTDLSADKKRFLMRSRTTQATYQEEKTKST
ncbi:MAG: NYN domain-containing protein [Patescibacteria group bacterium]|jgi:uncharacterized LabA/DUF88 family protein